MVSDQKNRIRSGDGGLGPGFAQAGRIPLGKRADGVEVQRGMGLSLSELREGLPEGGLFGGGAWRWSPEPLKISAGEARRMTSLGHPLARFQQACDGLYRRSAAGKLPSWLAELLDEGKPEWMARMQREQGTAAQFPRVIRPDLILTCILEIRSMAESEIFI